MAGKQPVVLKCKDMPVSEIAGAWRRSDRTLEIKLLRGTLDVQLSAVDLTHGVSFRGIVTGGSGSTSQRYLRWRVTGKKDATTSWLLTEISLTQ